VDTRTDRVVGDGAERLISRDPMLEPVTDGGRKSAVVRAEPPRIRRRVAEQRSGPVGRPRDLLADQLLSQLAPGGLGAREGSAQPGTLRQDCRQQARLPLQSRSQSSKRIEFVVRARDRPREALALGGVSVASQLRRRWQCSQPRDHVVGVRHHCLLAARRRLEALH
jgi:hypothetical protein